MTQADRKAAARLVSKMGDTIRALNILSGNLDDAPEVQAFAAHRIAERERCARVNYEALKAQMEANARLIAAAPELLYALENLLAVKNCEGGTMFDSDEIARAAIAKARGQA